MLFFLYLSAAPLFMLWQKQPIFSASLFKATFL